MQNPDDNQIASRRDRRIQRKRQEILAAATRIFAQKGYAAATTKDIANEADIGESTLYSYFASKRDILIAIAKETGEVFDRKFQEARGLENRAALVELLENAMDIFTERLDFTRTLVAEAWIDDEIFENYVMLRLKTIELLIEAFITDRVSSGVFRPVEPGLGARAVMGMFAGIVIPVLRGNEAPFTPEKRHQIAQDVVDVLLDGVRVRHSD
ncbi:MAG: TetR/AcrR family transcriptional regulator [Chloroflexi bacterium]|nr:TetR/AcrR family transcriptional regulator [Chloroflexota bacterium]